MRPNGSVILFLISAPLFSRTSSPVVMATGANTTPLGRLHPILAAKIGHSQSTPAPPTPPTSTPMDYMIPPAAMGGLLPTPYQSPAPTLSPASLGASKASSLAASLPSNGMGSKDPELKRHLEAAKRAASALFPGELESVARNLSLPP